LSLHKINNDEKLIYGMGRNNFSAGSLLHSEGNLMKIFVTILCFVFAQSSHAQLVGDNLFLQGAYVEVGSAPNGAYGTTTMTPTGYYPYLSGTTFTFYDPLATTTTTSGNFLGFVADYGRDGWTVGTPPFFGDFFLPGDPQEGWAVEMEGVESDAYMPAFQTSPSTGYTGNLAGTNIAYSNAGGICRGTWLGNDSGVLSIRQTTQVDTTALFFTTTVVLTNTGTVPLTNIFYMRTVDPDNDETRSSDYTTINNITYQLPDAGNKVLVSARGTVYNNAYLGLGTKDCRAKCMIFDAGLAPTYTFDQIWAQTTPYYYTLGYTYTDDVGIGLLFNIGTLAAGDSTELTYAYILDSAYIDSAFSTLTSSLIANDSAFTSGDSVNACSYPYDTFNVTIVNGGFYTWTWYPDSFISGNTGITNTVYIDSIIGTLTYTIVGVNGAGGCDSQLFYFTFVHDTFNFILNNHDTMICLGDTVQASVTGPGSLIYAWTPATGVSNTAIADPYIVPTVTTTYSVTASTLGGCTPKTKSFTINVAVPPSITVDSPLVKTCVGIPVDLHVYATPSGSYSYLWAPPTDLSSSIIFNPIVTPVAPGDINYTVTVTNPDLPTCKATDTVHVHTVPNNFVINSDTVICNGYDVLAHITGGSNEFTWLWSPPTFVSNVNIMDATFTPTTSTTYTLTASYAACPNMVHSFQIAVDYPAPVKNYTDTICIGASISDINYTVYDSGYYSYQWVPANYLNNDTIPNPVITPTVTGLVTYYVNVQPNAATCLVTDTVNILVIPDSFTLNNNDTFLCLGQTLAANITGGSTLYSWLWEPSNEVPDSTTMDATLTPTVSTTFTVFASAPYPGCSIPGRSVFIEVDYAAPQLTLTDTVCLGMVIDTINLTAPDTGFYSYGWSPGTFLNNDSVPNPVITPTLQGTYVYTVSIQPHAPACLVTDYVDVIVMPNQFPVTPRDTTICAGNVVQVLGTTNTFFQYQWIPTSGIEFSTIIDPLIAPDTSATYILSIYRAGCPTIYDTVGITVQPNPSIYIGPERSLCQFDTLHLAALVTPTFSGYSYSWSPTTRLNGGTDPTAIFYADSTYAPDSSGMVYCTVSTSAGCSATDSTNVVIYPGNFASLDTTYMVLCPNNTGNITASGGVSYQWNPSLFITSLGDGQFSIAPIANQNYTVIATSAQGCYDTLHFSIMVNPSALMNLPDSVLLYPGQTYQMNPQGNCVDFSWFPPAGLSGDNISNPIASPEVTTKYYVIGTSEFGCVVVDTITVYVDPQTLLAVPNAFTPGNGPNNVFKIIKNGLATLNYFRIFNRWGNMVFETTDIDNGWDGTFSGAPQPFDVYIYEIQAVTSTGVVFTKKGNVTLIR